MAVVDAWRLSAAMAPAAIRLEERRRRRWRRDRWGSRAVEALGMPHEEAAVALQAFPAPWRGVVREVHK